MAEQKFEKVKEFFEKEVYLLNRVNIEIRRAIISEFFPSLKDKRILDIGCGDGSLSLPFVANNTVVFLDAATQMIETARKKVFALGVQENATFVQGDIMQYDDKDKFDVILCIGVISHVENASKLLYRINSLLQDEGKVLIQFSDIDHFRYKLKRRFGKPDTYGYALNTFNRSKFFSHTDMVGLSFVSQKGYFWPFRSWIDLVSLFKCIF